MRSSQGMSCIPSLTMMCVLLILPGCNSTETPKDVATHESLPAATVVDRGQDRNVSASSPDPPQMYMETDLRGVEEVEFTDVEHSKLKDSEFVIGVVVNSQAYAISQKAMADPHKHVVNLILDDIPISMSHCDISGCSRVFTQDESDGRIDLRVGGRDIQSELVLLLSGKRYSQRSESIPLQDFEFETATFAEWKASHPDTKICEDVRLPGEDDRSTDVFEIRRDRLYVASSFAA